MKTGGEPPCIKRKRAEDTTKDAELVEDHLPASIHQGASNLHSDEALEYRG